MLLRPKFLIINLLLSYFTCALPLSTIAAVSPLNTQDQIVTGPGVEGQARSNINITEPFAFTKIKAPCIGSELQCPPNPLVVYLKVQDIVSKVPDCIFDSKNDCTTSENRLNEMSGITLSCLRQSIESTLLECENLNAINNTQQYIKLTCNEALKTCFRIEN